MRNLYIRAIAADHVEFVALDADRERMQRRWDCYVKVALRVVPIMEFSSSPKAKTIPVRTAAALASGESSGLGRGGCVLSRVSWWALS